MINMPNSTQEPTRSSKAQSQGLRDMNFLCTFKIKIEIQNLEYGCTKDQCPYQNQDREAKSQPGTSIILQSLISEFKEHGLSLHLQNQIREPKLGTWVYQRPVTISKSRSKIPVRNLQHPQKSQIKT